MCFVQYPQRKAPLLPSVIYDVRIRKQQTRGTQHSTERTGDTYRSARCTDTHGVALGKLELQAAVGTVLASRKVTGTVQGGRTQRATGFVRDGVKIIAQRPQGVWGLRKGCCTSGSKSWSCALLQCLFQPTRVYRKATWTRKARSTGGRALRSPRWWMTAHGHSSQHLLDAHLCPEHVPGPHGRISSPTLSARRGVPASFPGDTDPEHSVAPGHPVVHGEVRI